MSDLSEQIIELQSRALFQEELIQKLDEVIVQQGKHLDQLTRCIAELQDKVEQLGFERNNPSADVDEKPPHY
ncbi:MAG: SlyX family protein [Gammaproteobacteria bacterium]|nr:SlyX family protein [Gammaproteobacteria bacterium]